MCNYLRIVVIRSGHPYDTIPFITFDLVVSPVGEDAVVVETEAKVEALTGVADLGHNISQLSLSDAVDEVNIPDLNIALDHVMTNTQMSNTSQFIRIGGQ